MQDWEGLSCLSCGEACEFPRAHLAREDNSTSHLKADDPCLRYEETNKWGYRWRVVTARHTGTVSRYVDWMGDEDDFKVGGILIPSVHSDHHSDWNTVGECRELALATHTDNFSGYTRQ